MLVKRPITGRPAVSKTASPEIHAKETTAEANTTKAKSDPKAPRYREPGWRGMDSTAAFRAINPELFIRPNRVVMGIGLALITGCLGYIGYLNLSVDKTKETYLAMNEKDELERRYRSSKWD